MRNLRSPTKKPQATLIPSQAMQKSISNLSAFVKTAFALALILPAAVESRAAGPFTVSTTADTHAVSTGTSPNDSASHISAAFGHRNIMRSPAPPPSMSRRALTPLTLGELQVSTTASKTISIVGAGAVSTIINQGDGLNRVFNIDITFPGRQRHDPERVDDSKRTAPTRRITLAERESWMTACSTPVDVLTLMMNCVVQNNRCQAMNSSSNPGGGLSMEGGNLSLTGCTFAKNSSGSSQGGGVCLTFLRTHCFNPDRGEPAHSCRIPISMSLARVWAATPLILAAPRRASRTPLRESSFISNSVVGTFNGGTTYGAIQVQDESGSGNILTAAGTTLVGNSVMTSTTHTKWLRGARLMNSGQSGGS